MKWYAVLFFFFVCLDAFAGAGSTEPTVPPAAAQPEPMAEVRHSKDSDMFVKEMQSPITFDLDASWLRALPIGTQRQIKDLPRFFCDGITLERMAVTKHKAVDGVGTYFAFDFSLREREPSGDAVVLLEFVLVNGDDKFLLEYREKIEISGATTKEYTAPGFIPEGTFAAFTADASHPLLRVSMIVLPDYSKGATPFMLPIPLPIPIPIR